MGSLKPLAACAGQWQGTNRLHDPSTNAPEDSPSTVTVTPMLGGLFVRVEYSWEYEGAPQEGALLIGCEKNTGAVTAYWVDTWQMGTVAMVCRGDARPDGALCLVGSYAAPPGPDWGWRTVIQPGEDGTHLRMTMYNVSPDGAEEIAAEASYTRA